MLELVDPVIAVLAALALSGAGFLVNLPRREYAVLGLGLGLLLLGVSRGSVELTSLGLGGVLASPWSLPTARRAW